MTKAVTMRDVIAGTPAPDPRAMSERQVQEFGAALADRPFEASRQVQVFNAERDIEWPVKAPAECRVCSAIAVLDSAGLCGVSCVVVAECLRYIGRGRRVRAYMLAKQLRLIELDYPDLVKITRRKEDRGARDVFFFAAATRTGLEIVE